MINFRKLILFCLVCIALPTFAVEFVIINQTITWTMSSSSGFYFFETPASAPSDWESPDDYYNGQFYTRYEVQSIATDEPFGIQFGIWQDVSGETYHAETMETLHKIYTGTGIYTYNSSPSTWWRNYSGVDFSRISDFDRLGIVMWCLDPLIFIAQENWDGDPEVWNTRDRWFPCSIKVTVVAVSAGCEFSGWDNYVTPSTKHPTPTYGIDYTNELTNKVVPSTDEYSYSADMSDAVSGSGQKLILTPGTDVYFRTKASGDITESDIQHLDVPSKPASPSYTIDYINEKTTETVATTVEYSTSPAFTSSVTGTGNKITLTPGQDLYFRIKSTSSSFRSDNCFLDIASRSAEPSITIDFDNEVTSSISGSMEYSINSSLSPAANGENSTIPVTPGTDLYIRYKSTANQFSSNVQTLDVPARPAKPAFSIDFVNEKTIEIVPTNIEYSISEVMSGVYTGSGNTLSLTPGVDLYLRIMHTASSFASEAFHLVVPERPSISSAAGDTVKTDFFSATIDFHGETTGFEVEDVEVTNAEVTLADALTIRIEPIETGKVTIKIKPNVVPGGNFASETFSTYYREIISSIHEESVDKVLILVHPNPVADILKIKSVNKFILPVEIILINDQGMVTLKKTMLSSSIDLDMNGVSSGMYILKAIDSTGKITIIKISKR